MTETSFDTLVRPEVERLYRLAYRLTDSRADAEDLVQEVLVKAFQRRAELTSIEALGAWLARVLYNRFIDNRRRYERERLTVVSEAVAGADGDPDSRPGGAGSAEDAAALEIDIMSLQSALGALSLEQRAVLLMHDAEGYQLPEIQAITGIELGTLKSRLHRARMRLREILVANGTF